MVDTQDYNNKLLKNINEVSILIGIKKHFLRHWEKRIEELGGNILSLRKGRDGKRRYYREEDIQILKKIKYLMYIKKFTMKGAVNEIKKKSKNTLNYEISTQLKLVSKNLRNLINN